MGVVDFVGCGVLHIVISKCKLCRWRWDGYLVLKDFGDSAAP